MAIFKKFAVSTYLYLVAAVVTLVGFIFFVVSNGTQGNSFGTQAGLGITFAVFALVFTCFGVFAALKWGDKFWMPIILLVALACEAYLFGFIILNRVELISSLFSWDSGNKPGWSAFITSVVALVCYVVSSVCLTVGTFLPQVKKPEETAA